MSKFVDGWHWPEGEAHMLDWLANPKNRLILNGRSAYQGKKQVAAIKHCAGRQIAAIDAGAHIGLWSFNLAQAFGEVYAFKPVAAHRECFEKNVTAENVVMSPFALGDKPDMVSIRVNPTSTGDSWVKGKGDVEQRTIDSFGFTEVAFIKVDAEGYEEFIILGAKETIARCRPIICVEQKRDMATKFGLKPQGAVSLLKTWGYKVLEEIGGDYIMGPV